MFSILTRHIQDTLYTMMLGDDTDRKQNRECSTSQVMSPFQVILMRWPSLLSHKLIVFHIQIILSLRVCTVLYSCLLSCLRCSCILIVLYNINHCVLSLFFIRCICHASARATPAVVVVSIIMTGVHI